MSVQSSTGVGGLGTQMNQTAQPPYAGMHSIRPACKMNTLPHSKHCCWHLCLFACSCQGFARLAPQQAQLALLHTAATLLAATSKSLSVLHYAVLTTSAVYVYMCPSAHPCHAGHTDHTHAVCSYQCRQDGKCADGDINQALAAKASDVKQNTGRLPEVSRLPCLCNKTDHLHTKPPPAQTAA